MKLSTNILISFVILCPSTLKIHAVVITRSSDICQNEEYLTPADLPITCCSKEQLTPGISYEKFWAECATPDESEEFINTTLVSYASPIQLFVKDFHGGHWSIYECIVKKSLDGKSLTLENFASEMTKNYPEDKKKAILNSVGKNVLSFQDDETDLSQLKAIRKKYYAIELHACSTNASAIQDQMDNYHSYEHWYMRGGFCLNDSVPIHPNYYPFADDKEVAETWRTLLETVSVNDDQVHGDQIQRTCEISCSWLAQEIATADELFQRPDFQKIFERMKPKWVNKKDAEIIKKQIDEFWKSGFMTDHDNSTSTLEQHAINQMGIFYEKSLKSEFVRIRDEGKAKSLMTSCLVTTLIRSSIGDTLTHMCYSGGTTTWQKLIGGPFVTIRWTLSDVDP